MTTARQKYHNARWSAKERNIDWHFTFESWVNWWGDDLDKRGPKSTDLCMARIGDKGPYHPNNVCKLTVSENVKEMKLHSLPPMLGKTHSQETRNKLRLLKTGMQYSDEVNAKKGIKKSIKTANDMKV